MHPRCALELAGHLISQVATYGELQGALAAAPPRPSGRGPKRRGFRAGCRCVLRGWARTLQARRSASAL